MIEAASASFVKILDFSPAQILHYQNIPLIANHRYPFDRMLISVALAENFVLVSVDEKMKLYLDVLPVFAFEKRVFKIHNPLFAIWPT